MTYYFKNLCVNQQAPSSPNWASHFTVTDPLPVTIITCFWVSTSWSSLSMLSLSAAILRTSSSFSWAFSWSLSISDRNEHSDSSSWWFLLWSSLIFTVNFTSTLRHSTDSSDEVSLSGDNSESLSSSLKTKKSNQEHLFINVSHHFFHSSIYMYLNLPFSSSKTSLKLVNYDAVKKTILIYTTLPVLWPSVSEPNKGQVFSRELFACVKVIKTWLIPFFLKLFKIRSVIQTRKVGHKRRLHWKLEVNCANEHPCISFDNQSTHST